MIDHKVLIAEEQTNLLDEVALEAQEMPANWLWIIYLFFKPGMFGRTFLPNAANFAIVFWTILIGCIGVHDQVWGMVVNGWDVTPIASWFTAIPVFLITGAVLGFITIYLNGWLYSLRLFFSGATGINHRAARRALLFSTLITQIPFSILFVIQSFQYSTYIDYVHAYHPPLTWPWLLLSIWSSWIGFRYSGSISNAKLLGRTFWFLLLPCAFIICLFLINDRLLDYYKQMNSPKHYESAIVEFDYPAKWKAEQKPSKAPFAENIVIWNRDPLINLRVIPEPSIINGQLLHRYFPTHKMMYLEKLTNWAGVECVGARYETLIEDDYVEYRLYVLKVSENATLVVAEAYTPGQYFSVELASRLIAKTIKYNAH